LPPQPDSWRLKNSHRERQKDPERFPDLSLAIIKLLGRGEYIVAAPGGDAPAHFALAIEGYSHFDSANRRYPDVLSQRLVQNALAGEYPSYSVPDLADLADHCTEKENDANKAERTVRKSCAAMAMAHRVGEKFDGFITGAATRESGCGS